MPTKSDDHNQITNVKVNVSGTLALPLKLSLLRGIEDPVLEETILQEAVRLAVSERLGYFDSMDITIGYDEGGRKTCEARLQLDKLGECIESIQKAHEHFIAHAELMRELLVAAKQEAEGGQSSQSNSSEAGAENIKSSSSAILNAEVTSTLLKVVDAMLSTPRNIVEAAAASPLTKSAGSGTTNTTSIMEGGIPSASFVEEVEEAPYVERAHSATRMEVLQADENNQRRIDKAKDGAGGESYDYRKMDPEAVGYGGYSLLGGNHEDAQDEEEEVDYAAMGYTAL